MTDHVLQAAVCQFAATTDIAENTASCVDLIERAAQAGAELAVLPEAAMFFDPGRTVPGTHGQPTDGPFVQHIADAAAKAGIAVVVGMSESIDDPDRDSNTVVALSATGDLLGAYRKIHLYDAFGFKESDNVRPADIDRPLVFEVGGVRVGVATCYDLRFPEMFRWLVDAGADLIALPAAWAVGPAKEHHWSTLITARAIENTVYLAASGQTGPTSCGQSVVVDSMGTVVAGAGERPGLAVAPVSVERIAQVRGTNPSLANRRFTVVPR